MRLLSLQGFHGLVFLKNKEKELTAEYDMSPKTIHSRSNRESIGGKQSGKK